jgi:hypothetical protein
MNIEVLQSSGLGKNDRTRLYASAFGLTRAEQEAAREALKIQMELLSQTTPILEGL